MKKLVLVLALMLCVSTMAVAQDVSVVDVFGAYSFMRCKGQTTGDSRYEGCNMNGWNGGVDINLESNWAITIDISGHYGWKDNYRENVGGTYQTAPAPSTTTITTFPTNRWADEKIMTIMGGPRYTFAFVNERVHPYVHVLFGVSHVNPGELISETINRETGEVTARTRYQRVVENNFTQAYGGGINVIVSDKWFVRPVQVDYVALRRAGAYEKSFRIGAGFGYRIGVK